MNDMVECHSEYEYPERPVAIHWQGRKLEISRILTEWLAPNEKRFLVEVGDNQLFTLVYDQACDEWQIQQM
jgi:hypothetical protein